MFHVMIVKEGWSLTLVRLNFQPWEKYVPCNDCKGGMEFNLGQAEISAWACRKTNKMQR